MKRTQLYRHFNKYGDLLYVGISLSAVGRLMQHRDLAHWYFDIQRIEIETFETREDALIAEEKAIKTEKPAHNIRHSIRLQPNELEIGEMFSANPDLQCWRYCEVAQMLGIRESDVKRAVDCGDINAIKIGNRNLITRDEINRILNGGNKRATAGEHKLTAEMQRGLPPSCEVRQ